MRLVLVPNERMEDVVVLVVGCGLVVEGSHEGYSRCRREKEIRYIAFASS